MRILDPFEDVLCQYTGDLFVKAKSDGHDIVDFIERYMRCEVPAVLDRRFYRYGGCGPLYLYEEALDCFSPIADTGNNSIYGDSAVEWAGYMYRAWNWLTEEPSAEIIEICPAERMLQNWLYGHTVDPEMFIEDMKGWEP